MVDARNGFFKLQARTKLAKGDGTATVFSAAVAKENNTSVVQVDLEDGGQLFLMLFEIIPKEEFVVVRSEKRLSSSKVFIYTNIQNGNRYKICYNPFSTNLIIVPFVSVRHHTLFTCSKYSYGILLVS